MERKTTQISQAEVERQLALLPRRELAARSLENSRLVLVKDLDTAVEMNRNGDYGIPVPDYIEENVSTKVVKIIQSYTGVVDKMVWRKY